MTFPVRWSDAQPKPERGSAILAREEEDARRIAHEREVAKEVKAFDGRCRWPEQHKCRGGALEAAHIVDKSLLGATAPENMITLCPWIHRRGPESIHGKQLKVEKETPAGARGPLSFWKQTGQYDDFGQPIYFCVGRETSPGIIEKD